MRPPEALENSLVTTVVHSHTFKHQPGNVNDALPPLPFEQAVGHIYIHYFKSSAHFPPPFWIPFPSSPDLSNKSQNPHGWSWKQENRPSYRGICRHFPPVRHFVAVPFSSTSMRSAALGRMAWMDGRGKASSLKRPVRGKPNAPSASRT